MDQLCSVRARGWTLVELMAVLAVLAILSSIALPSFAAMLNQHRLTAYANEMHRSLSLARSEAVRSGRRVTVCTSRDGLWCDAAADWSAGWVMFADLNGNALRDAGELLIQSGAAAATGTQARGNGNMARYVSYVPMGTTQAVGGAFQAGTIQVCRNGHQRSLIVSRSGRVRVERADACSL